MVMLINGNLFPGLRPRFFCYVKEVYQFAVKRGIVTKDLTTIVIKPKTPEKRKDDELLYWDKDQINKFFGCIDKTKTRELEKYIAFKFLFLGGLRRGECFALNWSDLKIIGKDRVNVNVNKTLVLGGVNPPKTQAGYRVVPIIDKELVDALADWRIKQKDWLNKLGQQVHDDNHQLVFESYKNTPHERSILNKWMRDIIDKNGLSPKITVHKARHSFITNMLIAGVPPQTVQKLAGHSSPSITLAVYTHINDQGRVDAAQTLSNYMKSSGKDSEKDS